MTEEIKQFDAEVDKILHLMIHSLYTNKEIFLRELISNASDACDKLRYLSQTNASLIKDNPDFNIKISVDKEKKTLVIEDNGVGMDKEDLQNNLGKIASSGTQKFVESLSGDKKKDNQLIGQFGVGFYSCFMVADKVTVVSTKAADELSTMKWESEGKGSYKIEQIDAKKHRGTIITLHFKEDAIDILDEFRIKNIINNYSDHISIPIFFVNDKKEEEQINSSSALWKKSKSSVSKEQYNEFYKNISFDNNDPWLTLHNRNEGTLEFTNLLYVPNNKTFDLFHPDRKSRVKLYIRRVFIGDENIDIIPSYLRFLRGVVDSEDLPLNISRETLQHNNILEKIKHSLTKKVIQELKKQKDKNIDEYQNFWNNFGAVVKEGLCEPDTMSVNEKIMEIALFESAILNKKISLDEYIANIKDDKKVIYYICGEDALKLRSNPQIEGFLAKNIDVLLFTDTVDGFWVNNNSKYKDVEFKSVTRSDIDLDASSLEAKSDDDKKDSDKKESLTEEEQKLVALFKDTLGEIVKEVKISKKLTSSPVCITSDNNGMDIRMERYLVEQKQLQKSSAKILEINPKHEIVTKIAKAIAAGDDVEINKIKIHLLYAQACILEDEPITDANLFAKRLNAIL